MILVKTSAKLIHTRLSIHIPADLLKKYIIWSQSIWLASPTRSMILRCILFFQNKIKKNPIKKSAKPIKLFYRDQFPFSFFTINFFSLLKGISFEFTRSLFYNTELLLRNVRFILDEIVLQNASKFCLIFVIRKSN